MPAACLGLSMPVLALNNADNDETLATCMQYDSLDCLGTFQMMSSRSGDFRFTFHLGR